MNHNSDAIVLIDDACVATLRGVNSTSRAHFFLGYELGIITQRAEHDDAGFDGRVREENHTRIANALVRHGRNFSFTWHGVTDFEMWLHLAVDPRVPVEQDGRSATTKEQTIITSKQP